MTLKRDNMKTMERSRSKRDYRKPKKDAPSIGRLKYSGITSNMISNGPHPASLGRNEKKRKPSLAPMPWDKDDEEMG